jgi:hypothetical protein
MCSGLDEGFNSNTNINRCACDCMNIYTHKYICLHSNMHIRLTLIPTMHVLMCAAVMARHWLGTMICSPSTTYSTERTPVTRRRRFCST